MIFNTTTPFSEVFRSTRAQTSFVYYQESAVNYFEFKALGANFIKDVTKYNFTDLIDSRTGAAFTSVAALSAYLSQNLGNFFLTYNEQLITQNRDAFGLAETSSPQVDFDGQLTYDAQPLLYEGVENAGLITYDQQDGLLNISNNSEVGDTFVQTYRYLPYRPGIGKKVFITFNFEGAVLNNTKYVQFGDGDNAFVLRLLPDGTLEGQIVTETTQGNQSSPAIDLVGLGIDVNAEQICVIQFEALYVGSVQIGLQLGGTVVWVATLDNANNTTRPYIRTANLPVRVGIISTGTTPASMIFNCTSVQNMGGSEAVTGYDFSSFAEVTASNGTPTHALSVRPKLLFKTRTNRVDFIDFSIEIAVRGNSAVRWKLVIGQALTAPTYTDVNTDYSAMEFEANGTLSGTPALVIESGTILATNQNKGGINKRIPFKYPITLDAAGNHRDLGTLTLIVEGVGGNSICDTYIHHREVR